MARERMKITRPDQTGFGKSVQTGRPKLGAIDPEAIKGFKQPAAKAPELNPQTTEQPVTDLPPDPETAPVPQPKVGAEPGKVPPPAPSTLSAPPEMERKKREKPVESGLAELVLPPRSQAGRNPIQITLRLRALERHVPPLQELEARGFPREAVLRSAFKNMPKVRFEPRYVPQVQEVSAGNEWAWRFSPGVSPDVLSQIAAQVRDGDKAPRSALLLGQVEPDWFASLDETIERLLK